MKTNQLLNQLLADLNQMLTLTYQVHWYMRGERFLFLHPMLDSYIKEYHSDIDKVAELLIMQDGAPYATLQELAENTKLDITKGDYKLSMNDQLDKLLSGLVFLDSELDDIIKVAEAENNLMVIDTLQDMKESTIKHIWMIKSELGR